MALPLVLAPRLEAVSLHRNHAIQLMIYVIDATIRYSYSVVISLYSIFNFLPLGLRYDVTSHVESPASADERSSPTPLVVLVVQGGQVVRMDILQPSPC